MILIKQKSDLLGTVASSLCLVHCIATPFLFLAQAGSAACCESPPTWWKFMDYLFLAISFFAILWSTKTTTLTFIKPLMWLSYIMLSIVILNEKLELFYIPEAVVYIPAVGLIILHLYNRKFCTCKTDKCCIHES